MIAAAYASSPAPATTVRREPLLQEPVFAATGVALLILALPTLAAMLVDGRLFLGIDNWIKPLKFEVALAIQVFTLSFYARWLPRGTVTRRWFRIYVASVIVAIGYELAVIVGAAALGTASHFNEATATSSALYALMGLLAVWLTGASLVFGVLIARSDRAPRDPALWWGVVGGLILSFVMTVVFAGTMGSHGSHFVGAAGSDAGGLALMGWSRDGGDLRVAHFFGLHVMQALPIVGFAAGRLLARRPALVATAGFAVVYVAFCAATFVQALAGRPFLPGIG